MIRERVQNTEAWAYHTVIPDLIPAPHSLSSTKEWTLGTKSRTVLVSSGIDKNEIK